jgi:lysozyme
MTDPIATADTNTQAKSVVAAATDRLAKPWAISDQALPFIGTWENGLQNGKNFAGQQVTDGFILSVYNDSRGLPTVGCGHLVTAADKLKVGDKIKQDAAEKLLKKDLADAEKAVADKVSVPLYQYEYDALVSIAFNAGRSGFIKLGEFVNKGDYTKVPAFIEKFRTGGGNEGRRASEAALFKTGTYDATH